MATLLNGVNEVLKRVSVIDAGSELVALSSTQHQTSVDLAIQLWNEAIDELYSASTAPLPKTQAESTITLVADTRSYSLASDLIELRWPLIDKTNSQYIFEYKGGYNALLLLDLEQDDTGLPYAAAINPVDGTLHMDRSPTSAEAGNVYTYQYDKDTVLDEASDTIPVGNNAVYRALIPVVAEAWRLRKNNEFSPDMFRLSVGRAGRLARNQQARSSYINR